MLNSPDNQAQILKSNSSSLQIKEVGVIGAGQMGQGIAQCCIQHSYRVKLYDLSETILEQAKTKITAQLDKMIEKSKISQDDKQKALANLDLIQSYDDFANTDLVIEAVTENEQIKKSILSKVSQCMKPEGILASNTSSISITSLAASTNRVDRFIGIHFMNPVPIMKLVELIKGIATSEQTYQTAVAFSESLEKETALSEDYPAFIVNRILMPMINEAAYALYEGVGTITSIDKAMKLGANHPMGPFELADFIGLDTCLSIMQVLYEGLSDSKYRPCPLLVKYVEAGWLGRKTKKGFYDYTKTPPQPSR